MILKKFTDRAEAGRTLATLLTSYTGTKSVVYALPRGGLIVGKEIATALNPPLDLIITRKVSHPDNPEYALASVTEGGEVLCNAKEPSSVSESWFDEEVVKQQSEARRRRKSYLGERTRVSAKGKNAIIVDDGVATGLSIFLAIKEIKNDIPWKTIVAVPVISADVAQEMKGEVDEFFAIIIDENYAGSVGSYYENFSEVADEDVVDSLRDFFPPEQETISL